MKFSAVFVFALSALTTTVYALPPSDEAMLMPRDNLAKRQCGAEDTCQGAGGADLCNDRVSLPRRAWRLYIEL